MPRERVLGGASAQEGVTIWVNRDVRILLGELAAVEERKPQNILRRAIMLYADHSSEFQAWVQERRKARKAKLAA